MASSFHSNCAITKGLGAGFDRAGRSGTSTTRPFLMRATVQPHHSGTMPRALLAWRAPTTRVTRSKTLL
jgi:hypothetical protein